MGSARDVVGKTEHGLGDAADSDKLKGDGLIDQATGTIQHGYGVVKDAVAGAIDDGPGAVAGALDRGRELGRLGNEAVRERIGNNGPLYLLVGSVAVFALGAFALTRSTFNTARSTLRADDAQEVGTIASVLKQYGNTRVRIAGYTDARGPAAANVALGKARADAVKAGLVAPGIDAGRIETVSGRETNPVDTRVRTD